jgi:asparagine synthase (glutamine-hydrolysing)
MCGILQVFSRNKPVDRDRFESALRLMKHRGPDHTGVHHHPQPIATPGGGSVFAASGHQRLSILDLDERSNQPFVRGSQCLVFNGEIYNFRELRAGLDDGATRFTTTGDTEVLFHGLARHGAQFLRSCNGMWGFTWLDETRAQVLAARDRHGKKPVFYYKDDECLIVSSTIRPVFHYLGRDPRLRDEAVDAYISHGVMFPTAGGETHFHELYQIPAGHTLEFDLKNWSLKTTPYFSVREEVAAGIPRDEELPVILRDAVVSRLVSDRKVGLLLSGGIDSTLVLSVIHSAGLQDQVHCYIGETGRSEDADYAKRCVAQLGIDASVIDLGYGSDTLTRYLDMCLHQEKPFPFLGSSMGMSEMYEHIARDDVRVVLDGTGGDEIFGGYWDRQYPVALREAFATGDFQWLRSSLPKAPRPAARLVTALGNTLLRNERFELDFRALRKRFTPPSTTLGFHRVSAASPDPLARPPARFTEALIRDASPGGRLGEWIWHNDRNAMMSGIENRSPILDYRLVPFMGTGYATKYVQQWNKHQLRKVFDAFTPLPTQWRQQKQGFRWNGRLFLKQNREGILDIIASSPYLGARFNTRAFVDRARSSTRCLTSSFTPRLLCIAGIEERLGVARS